MTTSERPVALVTGGSRGIGAAIARALATAGYDLLLTYAANAPAADAVAADCASFGANTVVQQADAADLGSVERVFAALDEGFGRLDVLVNNAGVLPDAARTETFSAERVSRVLTVNTAAVVLCAGAAVRRMSTAHGGGGGVIVNISSRAAELGGAGEFVDYAMSKAAVDIMTRALANEVAREGIRVLGIRPGLIDTDMNAAHPGRLDRLGPSIPLGRVGTAEEVAQVVCWLVSPAASYLTGITIDVSGGR